MRPQGGPTNVSLGAGALAFNHRAMVNRGSATTSTRSPPAPPSGIPPPAVGPERTGPGTNGREDGGKSSARLGTPALDWRVVSSTAVATNRLGQTARPAPPSAFGRPQPRAPPSPPRRSESEVRARRRQAAFLYCGGTRCVPALFRFTSLWRHIAGAVESRSTPVKQHRHRPTHQRMHLADLAPHQHCMSTKDRKSRAESRW